MEMGERGLMMSEMGMAYCEELHVDGDGKLLVMERSSFR